jgi:hypothetical protein
MNKRIRELASKCVIETGSYECCAIRLEIDQEKFAELIVEEVYDYILNATFDDEPWPSRKDVKQHFGVEE